MKTIDRVAIYYTDGSCETIFSNNPLPMPQIPQVDPSKAKPMVPLVPVWSTDCPKCGLECKGVMGYCCPDNKCPMGLGSAGTLC